MLVRQTKKEKWGIFYGYGGSTIIIGHFVVTLMVQRLDALKYSLVRVLAPMVA